MNSWNNYWSNNPTGDCFSLDGNSDLSFILEKYWRDYFTVKSKGLKLLDLACGNGFVGKCAINSASSLLAIGVDSATAVGQLEFHNQSRRSSLRILAGLPIDQLQFSDNEFDLIVSQYGLEYSDYTKLLSKIVSQLKPNGELNLVLHSTQSVSYKRSEREFCLLNYLLEELQIFDAMRLNAGDITNLNKLIVRAKKEGVLLVENNKQIFQSIFCNGHIEELVHFSHKASIVLNSNIEFLEGFYLSFRERLRQQLNASLDILKANNLLKLLKEKGMIECKLRELSFEQFGQIGWEIKSTKYGYS